MRKNIAKSTKKDIIFSVAIIAVVIANVFTVFSIFSLHRDIDDFKMSVAILNSKEKSIRDATFQCFEETGNIDCDYLETLEDLREDFVQRIVDGDLEVVRQD